jgi:hypothetical protein
MDISNKPRENWRLDSLCAEARKYSTRSEFQKGNGSAYNAAGRLKVRDLVCAHMSETKKPNGYWTLDRLQAEALKYSTRQEFQQKSGAAYKAAGEQKCRDQICSHMSQVKQPKGYWTLENLKTEALKYDNKVDFRTHSNPAFLTASRKKLLDQICSHMEPGKRPNGYWLIKENCAAEALKYTNRRAFSIDNSSAYHGADTNGWLEEICAHMDFNPSSDSDAVYIWRAIGHEYNKLPVYKFGTTSARLNDRRISEVAKSANMEFEIVLLTEVAVHSAELEVELLKLGANPKYSGFNGASEFRALTEVELQSAIDLIRKFQVNTK